jgi:hypothetical protein
MEVAAPSRLRRAVNLLFNLGDLLSSPVGIDLHRKRIATATATVMATGMVTGDFVLSVFLGE